MEEKVGGSKGTGEEMDSSLRHESELYIPIKRFWEERGYIVRGEVNDCDLVAYRDEDEPPVIVELKKRLNIPLLVQGMRRLELGGRVYVAVPFEPRSRKKHGYGWPDLARLCQKIGMGLLTVKMFIRKEPRVEVWADPPPSAAEAEGRKSHRKLSLRQQRLKQEFFTRSGDFNLGGAHNRPIVTVYREAALHLAWLLKERGPQTVADLRNTSGEPKTQRILADNYYGWFERIRRGTYAITEEGLKALERYRDVVMARLER